MPAFSPKLCSNAAFQRVALDRKSASSITKSGVPNSDASCEALIPAMDSDPSKDELLENGSVSFIYIFSGALTPSRAKELKMTWAVAWQRVARAECNAEIDSSPNGSTRQSA